MGGSAGTVLVVANLDTRGAEFARLVRALVRGQGLETILMDVSMEQVPPVAGDVACEEVAAAGGMDIEAVRAAYRSDRKTAADCMIRGGGRIAADLHRQGRVDGVFAAGGATATLIATSIMKRLPFGVPKIVASSVAGHPSYVDRYVGTRDIMLLNTVVDVMDMNPLLRRQLANAVGAVCGAVRVGRAEQEAAAGDLSPGRTAEGSRPIVGVTSFGFAERSVETAIAALRERGFEAVPFHAQGRGDRAMDELVRDGMIAGVVDLVTRGVGEEMLGGNCAAGPDRVLAAAESGLPQVLAPSGLDMLSVGGQPGWETRFAGRPYAMIDELRVEVRTSAEECRRMARELARRLDRATAPYLFLLPEEGWSSLDRAGAPLRDPEADAAFAEELAAALSDPGRIRRVPLDLYSPEFGVVAAEAFVEVWAEHVGAAV